MSLKWVLLFLITVSSLFSQQTFPSGAELCSKKNIARINLHANTTSAQSPVHLFDVLHYSLNLDLYKNFSTPFPKSFNGSVSIKFIMNSPSDSIQLDAVNSSLQVDSVSSVKSFLHTSNILTLLLNGIHSVGDTLNVIIYYQHKDVADKSFYVGSDGMVFTDAEPEGARKWFPCWDKPSDKATFELYAKVPTSVKLGSNGILTDTLRNADTLYYHWVSRDPVATYLMVISAKVNYNLDIVYWKKLSNSNDSIPIYFYWNTGETVTKLNNIKSKILPMMTRYSQLFGEHPFEKNGFATLNKSFSWGGMENQTLTSLCPNCWTENLISHEFAHQWFGDMVTCGTWADIWLNEGFATYCEALWYEYTGGYSEYKLEINYDANDYLAFNRGWAIYNSNWSVVTPDVNTLFNTAITYEKSACVLHMLRYVLGDSVFFAAIKSYATDNTFRFNNAVTDDFIQKISTTTNQDLTWFFDEWLNKPNHPNYSTEYLLNSSDSTALVLVSQTQSVGFWKMPVELNFSLSTGKDTTVRVFNSANNQSFVIKLNAVPTAFTFDPNNNIVLKTYSTAEVTSVEKKNVIPEHFVLLQNYPNPFNPSTIISYQLPITNKVSLKVFDALGREVVSLVDEIQSAGNYSVQFSTDQYHLSSGAYFYKLQAGEFTEVKPMMLIR